MIWFHIRVALIPYSQIPSTVWKLSLQPYVGMGEILLLIESMASFIGAAVREQEVFPPTLPKNTITRPIDTQRHNLKRLVIPCNPSHIAL